MRRERNLMLALTAPIRLPSGRWGGICTNFTDMRFVLNSWRTMPFRYSNVYFLRMEFWQPKIPYDSPQISINAVLKWEFIWNVSGANANHDLFRNLIYSLFVILQMAVEMNAINKSNASLNRSVVRCEFRSFFSMIRFFSVVNLVFLLNTFLPLFWPNEFDDIINALFEPLTLCGHARVAHRNFHKSKVSFFRNCTFYAFECEMKILLLK